MCCWLHPLCKRSSGSFPLRELAVLVQKGRGGAEWDPVQPRYMIVKIVFNSVCVLSVERKIYVAPENNN